MRVFLCHCEDCQMQSGSAFRSTAILPPERFELTRGRLQRWEKVAESGRGRVLAFRPRCGTHVYGGPADGAPGLLSLRVGPLEQRRALPPRAQVWCRSRLDWLDDLSGIPGFDGQPGLPSAEPGAGKAAP
jgi:hypothetical protein